MRTILRVCGILLFVAAIAGGVILPGLPMFFPGQVAAINGIEQSLLCNPGERLGQQVETVQDDDGIGSNVYSNCISVTGKQTDVNWKLLEFSLGIAAIPALVGLLLVVGARPRRKIADVPTANVGSTYVIPNFTVYASPTPTSPSYYPAQPVAGYTCIFCGTKDITGAACPNCGAPRSNQASPVSATSPVLGQVPLTAEFLSREQVLAIPNLFILKKEHKRFLAGETRTFRPAGNSLNRGCTYLLVTFFVVMAGGFLWLQLANNGNRGDSFGVTCSGIALVFALSLYPLMAWLYRRWNRLGREGRFLIGCVETAAWKADDEGFDALTVHYDFQSPTGHRLTHAEIFTPSTQGWHKKSEPEAPAQGTLVAVLYVDDRLYHII